MKRLSLVILAGLIAVTLLPTADAAPKKKQTMRTEEANYEGPGLNRAGEMVVGDCEMNWGCVEFEAKPTERFVRIELDDDTGVGPFGELIANGETLAKFCASTELPVAIPAGAKLEVRVYYATFPFTPCGPSTTGTVVATFWNTL